MKLKDIAEYVTDKVSSDAIDLGCYVTTDSLLQNKAGRETATNLPPQTCTLTLFRKGDILISNIRPYLKKIWMADVKGGCNADVLVFRAKEGHSSEFLYALLLQDAFFDYAMKGAKGSKMPRGDKEQIMRYEIPTLSSSEESIGKFIVDINQKIAVNREINRNLEAMARQLYDYWFVQFEFPDENGKPYKSSGGKMIWNQELHREIPEEWTSKSLVDIAVFTNGLACQKFRPINEIDKLPVIKIREMRDGFTNDTEFVKSDIPDSVKVYNGDVLFSWSASLEILLWAFGNGGLNQHIFKVTSRNGYPRSFFYFEILRYIGVFKRIAESRKTTMGHITQDHLEQSRIAVPKDTSIVTQFDNKLKPIMDSIVKNQEEIVTLQQERDSLLPLLMNGQVSVMPTAVNCDLSHG